jgi:hypothetical protein
VAMWLHLDMVQFENFAEYGKRRVKSTRRGKIRLVERKRTLSYLILNKELCIMGL